LLYDVPHNLYGEVEKRSHLVEQHWQSEMLKLSLLEYKEVGKNFSSFQLKGVFVCFDIVLVLSRTVAVEQEKHGWIPCCVSVRSTGELVSWSHGESNENHCR
jgi:hypothetical protein